MKQKIRLTESQLYNIIKESVKQILNELDPRTYASLAQKRQQQGDELSRQRREDMYSGRDISKYNDPQHDQNRYYSKAQQARQAAQNAFNQQYAQQGDYMAGGDNYNVSTRYTDGSQTTFMPHRNQVDDSRGNWYNGTRWRNAQRQDYANHPSYRMANQMNNPNAEQDYVKGQGWR